MATVAEKPTGFRKASAQELPKLHNIGYVSSVGEPKLTNGGLTDDGEEKPQYVMIPVEITGINGSRNGRTSILLRPEWLDVNFNPDRAFDGLPESVQRSLSFVYRRNIGSRGEVSVLEGLAGSEAAGAELAQAILSVDNVEDAEAVAEAIRTFLLDEQRTIGYTMKQRSTKTDEVDPETGKAVYVLDKQYDVDTFWYPTEKEIKRLEKVCEKSQGRQKLAFDVELAF